MTLLCVPLVGRTVEEMEADAAAAAAAGGDLVEIRLDFIEGFRPREHLPRLLRGCPLPALVTYRFDPLAHFPCFPSSNLVLLIDSASILGYPERVPSCLCGIHLGVLVLARFELFSLA